MEHLSMDIRVPIEQDNPSIFLITLPAAAVCSPVLISETGHTSIKMLSASISTIGAIRISTYGIGLSYSCHIIILSVNQKKEGTKPSIFDYVD